MTVLFEHYYSFDIFLASNIVS